MNNSLIQLKVKERLNKLDSADYSNIECWQIQEAINKAQIERVRKTIYDNLNPRVGAESTTRAIDDLQSILIPKKLSISETLHNCVVVNLPEDYMEFRRVSISSYDERCRNQNMTVWLINEADLDVILTDPLRNPSYEWGETVATISDGKLKIYKDDSFDLQNPILTYYRIPRKIVFKGCINIFTEQESLEDVPCEFKDDFVELIITDAVAILAGDIEHTTAYQINAKNSERNN